MEILDENIKTFLKGLREGNDELAHAIRSPLSVILGIVEDLESGTELSQEDVCDARNSVDRIISLLNKSTLGNTLTLECNPGLQTALRNTFPDFKLFNSICQEIETRLPTACLLSAINLIAEEFEQKIMDGQRSAGISLITFSGDLPATDFASCDKVYLIISRSEPGDFNESDFTKRDPNDFSHLSKTKIAILKFLLDQSASQVVEAANQGYGVLVKVKN